MTNMTLYETFVKRMKEVPVMAILRGISAAEVEPVCKILIENGITLLEIPLNTPNALDCIRLAREKFSEKALIGAGTVLTTDEVESVFQCGGKFIVSPNTNPAVIRRTKETGMLSIPGFLTPTEGFSAIDAGADFLKLFPAGRMGIGYLKDLQAVIKTPMIATGAINIENFSDFCQATFGVGISSAIYKPGKTLEEIERDVKKFASKYIP